MIPKCTSWRGHKFVGRYSKSPSEPSGDKVSGSPELIYAHMESRRSVTYERDICVRCGVTVELPIEITQAK